MNDSSNVNTVILVLILAIIVGALVWFFTGRAAPAAAPKQDAGQIKVDVNLSKPGVDSGGGQEQSKQQ